MKNKYIYGPVPSRRLGISLGIDLIPLKTCSYDCIYCQLGPTTKKTIRRMEYVKIREVLEELETSLQDSPTLDYIAISGSGEPTLNSKLGELISEVKKMSSVPVAVLTNASRLIPSVREGLYKADLILPSLDVVTQSTFKKINRPRRGLRIEHTISNLKILYKYFQGKTWLEVMLVKGINDNEEELTKMAEVLKEINPDKIQLNTVTRPPSESGALPLSKAEMESVRSILGEKAEIIGGFKGQIPRAYSKKAEESIITLLRRRPCTISDISSSLGIHRNEVIKYLAEMESRGEVRSSVHASQRYFRAK